MIVRAEQALGFHTDDRYISKEQVHDFNNRPYEESSLLPIRSRQWGQKKSKYSYSAFYTVNILAVALSGLVAIVAVCFAR